MDSFEADMGSDTTLCASNIFDSDATQKCQTFDKTTNSYQKQWETVQTLDRASVRSKQQKITESDPRPKKTNSTSNPITYLKSALFSQKLLQFRLRPQTSSLMKRTVRQSMSLIVATNRNDSFERKDKKSLDSSAKRSSRPLFQSRSDESLESNPNSVCSCLSNCDICNDILNNCLICQQLNKHYANALKLKSNQLFSKQLIQSAINQISLAQCQCLSCASQSCASSASGAVSDHFGPESRLIAAPGISQLTFSPLIQHFYSFIHHFFYCFAIFSINSLFLRTILRSIIGLRLELYNCFAHKCRELAFVSFGFVCALIALNFRL